MERLEVGQKVRVRFRTIADLFCEENKNNDKKYQMREGVVTYIHPKGRYVTVATQTRGGTVTESFAPMDFK